MKRVMVRYTVKPDQVAENERFIERVFRELERAKPAGLRYASFKLDDGVSFVHFASHDTPDGSNPLGQLAAFREFSATVKERCVSPPIVAQLSEVGSYGFFTD